MAQSYIALGSNIETDSSTRYDFLVSAIRQLSQSDKILVTKASHVYETEPVGYENQEKFYNAVIELSTTFAPHELLLMCLDVVEKRAGRTRTLENGPRTLDADILMYDDLTINEDNFVLPHPRMTERAFVMVPLLEIAPELVGDITQYRFVDDVDGVVKTELNFEELLISYRDNYE